MRYLYKRGGGRRRVMHLGGYDPLTGQPSVVPLCGRDQVGLNTTCNLPLGRPTCKRCLAEYQRLAGSPR